MWADLQSGLDSPGKTYGNESLVLAWPKAAPELLQHFALGVSTLYNFVRGWP